jgi:hypothetical protein
MTYIARHEPERYSGVRQYKDIEFGSTEGMAVNVRQIAHGTPAFLISAHSVPSPEVS